MGACPEILMQCNWLVQCSGSFSEIWTKARATPQNSIFHFFFGIFIEFLGCFSVINYFSLFHYFSRVDISFLSNGAHFFPCFFLVRVPFNFQFFFGQSFPHPFLFLHPENLPPFGRRPIGTGRPERGPFVAVRRPLLLRPGQRRRRRLGVGRSAATRHGQRGVRRRRQRLLPQVFFFCFFCTLFLFFFISLPRVR